MMYNLNENFNNISKKYLNENVGFFDIDMIQPILNTFDKITGSRVDRKDAVAKFSAFIGSAAEACEFANAKVHGVEDCKIIFRSLAGSGFDIYAYIEKDGVPEEYLYGAIIEKAYGKAETIMLLYVGDLRKAYKVDF